MRLKLAVDEIQHAEEVRELVQSAQGYKTVIKDGHIVETNGEDMWTQGEIFAMGFDFGREKERALWKAPESFQIHKDFAALLREAISDYSEKTMIKVDSISITGPDDMQFCTITVQPTQAIHMFGICSEYGKKVAAFKK